MKEYIDYDRTKGHPCGPGLFYECGICGGLLAGDDLMAIGQCPCGNIYQDIGRLGARDETQMRLVRITPDP